MLNRYGCAAHSHSFIRFGAINIAIVTHAMMGPIIDRIKHLISRRHQRRCRRWQCPHTRVFYMSYIRQTGRPNWICALAPPSKLPVIVFGQSVCGAELLMHPRHECCCYIYSCYSLGHYGMCAATAAFLLRARQLFICP